MTTNEEGARESEAARVIVDVRGPVVVLTLNRHERANAIDAQMTSALDAALNDFEDDPLRRVAVITGGPEIFSGGTDLVHGSGPATTRGGEYGIIRRRSRKPLIAAVEGAALGGGFEIVLACDFAISSDTARFGLPEVARGLVASSGALFRAPARMPLAVAAELLLTGREMSAPEAMTWGIVNRVTPEREALEAALALAAQITQNSPAAVQTTLGALHEITRTAENDGWRVTARSVEQVLAAQDHVEGIAAFRERRPPRWAPSS